MAAAKELLINIFVAAAAIPCSQFRRDHETVMIFLLLSGRGLVTVETVHALPCMGAHFVFVHDRVLGTGMAFGALSGSAHEGGTGLISLNSRPRTVDQECGKYQRECNHDSDEYRPK